MKEIIKLKTKYDPFNKYTLDFALKKYGLNAVFAEKESEVSKNLPKDSENIVVITNGSVPRKFVDDLGHFKKAYLTDVQHAHMDEVKRVIESIRALPVKPAKIIGFGGGVALDVAKKVAKLCPIGNTNENRINDSFIVVPTAGSNDGIISPNASLFHNGMRETLSANAPSKIIIPLYIWDKNWKNRFSFSKSGVCDVLSNLTSLQEWNLAIRRDRELWTQKDIEYLIYALDSLIYITEGDLTSEKRAMGLLSSSFSMYDPKLSSRPASGGEHEIERALSDAFARESKMLVHGQGACFGSLIIAKLYERESSGLPDNLFFNPKTLYETLVNILKQMSLHEYVKEPVSEIGKDKIISALETAPKIRERYGILKEINYTKEDWKAVLEEII